MVCFADLRTAATQVAVVCALPQREVIARCYLISILLLYEVFLTVIFIIYVLTKLSFRDSFVIFIQLLVCLTL